MKRVIYPFIFTFDINKAFFVSLIDTVISDLESYKQSITASHRNRQVYRDGNRKRGLIRTDSLTGLRRFVRINFIRSGISVL